MMNVINGGAHANNQLDMQEFMIVPVGAQTFREALRCGAEVFQALKKMIDAQGHVDRRGRRGRLRARTCRPTKRRSSSSLEAIDKAGYTPGQDVVLALDCAASEFYKDGTYVLESEGKRCSSAQLRRLPRRPGRDVSRSSRIEDGMAENDWDGWKPLTDAARARRCSSSATISSSPTRRSCAKASSAASPTRS